MQGVNVEERLSDETFTPCGRHYLKKVLKPVSAVAQKNA